MNKTFKLLAWILPVIGGAFFVLVIARTIYFYNLDETDKAVTRIHATRLAMRDVTGENLPPEPGADTDATITGVDANANGIRDDVELAIFRTYPNSAKIRAALLQYALALQMEFTQKIINTQTVTAVAAETSRGNDCISNLVPRESPESFRTYSEVEKIDTYISFVENQQLNTQERKMYRDDFYTYLDSYELPSGCDIDPLILPN